jgi:hypothetical protein
MKDPHLSLFVGLRLFQFFSEALRDLGGVLQPQTQVEDLGLFRLSGEKTKSFEKNILSWFYESAILIAITFVILATKLPLQNPRAVSLMEGRRQLAPRYRNFRA